MNEKTNFVTAHQAALAGLPRVVRNDQALAGVFEGGHLFVPQCVNALGSADQADEGGKGASQPRFAKPNSIASVDEQEQCIEAKQQSPNRVARHGSCPLLLCGAALGFTLAKGVQQRLSLPAANLVGMSAAKLADCGQLDAGSNANLADLGPRHGSEGFPEGLKVELIIHLRIVHPFMDSRQALNLSFYG